jgi:amidase
MEHITPTAHGTSDQLWRWSARQLAYGIATRQISASEAAESCLNRIDEVNPDVNALVEVSRDEALQTAAEADRLTVSGAELGPLHGVPVAMKVNSDQEGHATTNGVAAFKDNIAPKDSPQVANLRRSGAVFLGRSNTPAFSYRWFTSNDVHGRTLNPWDRSRTPGGSSGGAGSAVATGMVPIAHGNDIAGSIRYPAYACGLVGLRPTVGRIAGTYGPPDMDSSLSVQSFLVQGPLARSVDDIRLAMRGMAGADPRDPVFVPGAPAAFPPQRPFRVALVRDHGLAAPAAAVDDALDQAARSLEDAGYVVEEVDLPLLAEAHRLWWLVSVAAEFRPVMPLVDEFGDEAIKKAAEGFFAVTDEWFGGQPSLTDYMNAYARRGTLIRKLAEFLQLYSMVLLPVSAEQAFEQDADLASLERLQQIIAANSTLTAIPFLGFPAVSVPTGVVNGLPAGVQLLGRRFDEDGILNAAEVIEARAGTFTPIDPR